MPEEPDGEGNSGAQFLDILSLGSLSDVSK